MIYFFVSEDDREVIIVYLEERNEAHTSNTITKQTNILVCLESYQLNSSIPIGDCFLSTD